MKVKLIILGLLVCGFVLAQQVQTTITIPALINMPTPTPSGITQHVKIPLQGNVLAPFAQGVDFIATITNAQSFSLGTFPKDSFFTLFIINNGSNQLTWPSGLTLVGGKMPTTQGRAAIVFEEVNGEIWASPSTQ